MSEPLQGTWVTSREIYDAVVRLTGRVDVLIVQQNHTSADVADIESRLRTVEKRLWALPSVATLIALTSTALTVIQFFR